VKANPTNPEGFESTYALILREEEKQRSRFETLAYAVLIMSTVFAVSQFGREAVTMPSNVVRSAIIAPAVPHRA